MLVVSETNLLNWDTLKYRPYWNREIKRKFENNLFDIPNKLPDPLPKNGIDSVI
jgi:hypothetical protein